MSEENIKKVWSPHQVLFSGNAHTVSRSSLEILAEELTAKILEVFAVRVHLPTNTGSTPSLASMSITWDRNYHPDDGTFWETDRSDDFRELVKAQGLRMNTVQQNFRIRHDSVVESLLPE